MRQTRTIMSMTVQVEIVDENASDEVFKKVFSFLEGVDEQFSTFKNDSEISKINRGEIKDAEYSNGMKEIFELAEITKKDTNGYFDIIAPGGKYDPLGIVKGWAIHEAALILKKEGYKNFFVDISGDIEVSGTNKGEKWKVGIRNPFNFDEIIKVVGLENGKGLATSGNYMNGNHIYNPVNKNQGINDIVSLTVIGPNALEADRFATPAFAMGRDGINFIENLPGFEGYMIDKEGYATMTSNFEKYVIS